MHPAPTRPVWNGRLFRVSLLHGVAYTSQQESIRFARAANGGDRECRPALAPGKTATIDRAFEQRDTRRGTAC